MDELFIQNAQIYASRRRLQLAERLGSGVHGIIFVADSKAKDGKTAIKVHREIEPYLRERKVYTRLAQARITIINGFNVPQFIHADDDLLIVEMSIVTRPFVLDFAGAHLDQPPDFSEEAWSEWESAKREQFDAQWPTVQAILDSLKESGIYMIDVSPGNIAFPL